MSKVYIPLFEEFCNQTNESSSKSRYDNFLERYKVDRLSKPKRGPIYCKSDDNWIIESRPKSDGTPHERPERISYWVYEFNNSYPIMFSIYDIDGTNKTPDLYHFAKEAPEMPEDVINAIIKDVNDCYGFNITIDDVMKKAIRIQELEDAYYRNVPDDGGEGRYWKDLYDNWDERLAR